MKTIFEMRGSSAAHFALADVNWICSCTPWKTNLVAPAVVNCRTPFER